MNTLYANKNIYVSGRFAHIHHLCKGVSVLSDANDPLIHFIFKCFQTLYFACLFLIPSYSYRCMLGMKLTIPWQFILVQFSSTECDITISDYSTGIQNTHLYITNTFACDKLLSCAEYFN